LVPAGILRKATPAWVHLRPPERLFGLANDIAPRKSNVMQVAIGPLGQFAPLTPTLPPDVEGFAELREKPEIMMIYHLMM
jgi:hypothetical protein